MKLIRTIAVTAIAIALGQMGYASTYYVATNGNDSAAGTNWYTAKKTIQTAINTAVEGDTVLVSAGIYSGTGNRNLSISSKNISVVSESGPKTTFIDCGNATRAVTFSGNMTNTWLIGFTIRNGYLNENRDWGDGGIIYIDTPAGPIIDRCIIVSNRIDCSFLTAQPGLITFNTTGAASLRNSLVINNIINGGSTSLGGYSAVIRHYGNNKLTHVVNCTISGNVLTGYLRTSLMRFGGTSVNVISWGNTGENAVTQEVCDGSFTNCLSDKITGSALSTSNPLFVGTGDYRLQASSPAINSGIYQGWMSGSLDLAGVPRALDDATDIGAYEYVVGSGENVVPVGKVTAVAASTENSGDGGTSIQLGGVGLLDDGEMAGIEWSVTGAGVLSFDWKVVSEAYWDVLRFYEVGAGETNVISGKPESWERITRVVEDDSPHTFRWEYEKDPIGDYIGLDCGWIDAINWAPFFDLSVNSGTGGGTYTNGTIVAISADEPPVHHIFDVWTGDTGTITDVNAASTTLTMPKANAAITATYKPIPTLTVNGGTGGGYYTNGTIVAISADEPPAHHIFDVWTGDTGTIADVNAASTTMTMPEANAAITATYKERLYPVEVVGGQGGGGYTYGSTVTLSADIPEGKRFDRWIGDTTNIADVNAPTTTVYFAGEALAVTSTYCVPLTVTQGTGSGWYPEGATAAVTADRAAMWMEFAGWVGDGAGQVENVFLEDTTMLIPTRPSALTATYTDSVARVAGCYGRVFTRSGAEGGISTEFAADSPYGTPAVRFGGPGVIPDSGYAAFETVVSGSGSIIFRWKVSSENNADYLRFNVDGTNLNEISGTKAPWTQVSNRVEGAQTYHTLRWEYVKDSSYASSIDCGWVDDIIWVPDYPDPKVTPAIVRAARAGQNMALEFMGERGVEYYLQTNSSLTASGWGCLSSLTPSWLNESNGLHRFEITPPVGQENTLFYRVITPVPFALYMIIDLSGGPSAVSYPVISLDAVPAGGWTDEHKTTKLVLRRISAGTFTMGSPTGELGHESNETQHQVTLTKDFYIGVFEVTQRQWELVTGNKPSWFNNAAYYQTRPAEQVSYYEIRENPANSDDPAVDWPASVAVNADSFMGKIREKTGLTDLDLPTESQWEYACRAGTTTALNNGKNLTSTTSCPNMAQVGRYLYNGGKIQNGSTWINPNQDCTLENGTAAVGSYVPNAWGIYDMHGNVWEWCLDWLGTYPGAATDPKGVSSGSYRVLRSGSWLEGAHSSRSANRAANAASPAIRYTHTGFRAAMTLP